MPKLPSKEFAATSLQRDVDSLDAVDEGDMADDNDCLLFERRLNDWADSRCRVDAISNDPHLLICDRCQATLNDFRAMLEATELLGVLHDDGVEEDALVLGGRATSLVRLPADSARSQIAGWSTLLAVLFVIWGASAGVPTDMSLTEGVSPASVVGAQMEPSEFVNGLSFAELSGELSGYPSDLANHFVSVNPLVQDAPTSFQTFFEMPTGRLLAAGLPAVDLASFDITQLNHIGRYWQHASRLPGIEPWQHSVNFAIGWFSQSAMPNGNPQCG